LLSDLTINNRVPDLQVTRNTAELVPVTADQTGPAVFNERQRTEAGVLQLDIGSPIFGPDAAAEFRLPYQRDRLRWRRFLIVSILDLRGIPP
jgi:hypothetical protein